MAFVVAVLFTWKSKPNNVVKANNGLRYVQNLFLRPAHFQAPIASNIQMSEDEAKKNVIHNKKRTLSGQTQSFEPISRLTVVYDNSSCPDGYESVSDANLNSGTDGQEVTLCYARDNTVASICEVDFVSNFGKSLPSCEEGWETVTVYGTTAEAADLNKGTGRPSTVMCFRRSDQVSDEVGGINFFRVLPRREELREYVVHKQNLNQGTGGDDLYLASSQSPSMSAAALSLVPGVEKYPLGTLDWLSVVEDSSANSISATARIDCQRNGGDSFLRCVLGGRLKSGVTIVEMSDAESHMLCELAQIGMEKYWSGPVTLHGITRNITFKVVDTGEQEPNKDVDLCWNDGSVPGHSFNADFNLLDLALIYNPNAERPGISRDEEFLYTAGREIGHSFLYKYAGLTHSWGHKGTSSLLGDINEDSPDCPEPPGNIDLMQYYSKSSCKYENTAGSRIRPTNWDMAKVLMTAGTYQIV